MMEEKLCPNCEEPVIDKFPACPLQCMSPKCKAYMKPVLINTEHKPVIWILGGPGSGKSTLCKTVIAKYGYTHLCTGDLLRAEAQSDSNRATCIRNILKRGVLVPSDIVLDIIREKIKQMEPSSNGFIIDGYPRDQKQAETFEKTVCQPNLMFSLEVGRDIMLTRLQKVAKTSPHIDENVEIMNTRIATYMKDHIALLDLYADSGKLKMIDAAKPPEGVFAEVVKHLDPLAVSCKNALETARADAAKLKSQPQSSSQSQPQAQPVKK